MTVLEPNDPALHADPYPAFARLREEAPVYWSPAFQRWMITRYDDVRAAYLDPVAFSSATFGLRTEAAVAAAPGQADLLAVLSSGMLLTDPPDHTRLRRLVSRAFTPRSVERQRERVAGLTRQLLSPHADGASFDLVCDFAGALPILVIAEMVGVPLVDREQFRLWGDQLAAFIEGGASPERGSEALAGAVEMCGYLMDIIARRRREPADDLLGTLIAAEEEGGKLSTDEIVGMVILLISAGHETTTSLLVNSVRLLLDERQLAPRLAAEPEFRKTAIEEVLRFEPPIQINSRVLTRDVTLHGVTMPAGSGAGLVIAAANRDPRVFADPEAFNPDRSPNPHLSFGQGIHACIGLTLARLEAQVALGIIAGEFPGLRTLPGESVRKPSATLHGFVRVPAGIAD